MTTLVSTTKGARTRRLHTSVSLLALSRAPSLADGMPVIRRFWRLRSRGGWAHSALAPRDWVIITGVPIGVHWHAQRITRVGIWTHPWPATSLLSLPGPTSTTVRRCIVQDVTVVLPFHNPGHSAPRTRRTDPTGHGEAIVNVDVVKQTPTIPVSVRSKRPRVVIGAGPDDAPASVEDLAQLTDRVGRRFLCAARPGAGGTDAVRGGALVDQLLDRS